MDETRYKTFKTKPSQAKLFLEHLHNELQTIQSISTPAQKLRLFALATDLISAKNYFRNLREGLNIQLMHDIDRDVDYEEWYKPEKWSINFDKILWEKKRDNYGYEPNNDELNAVSELINRKEIRELELLQDTLNKTESKKRSEEYKERIARINDNTLNVNRAMTDWTEKMLSNVYFSFDALKNAIQQGIFDLVNEIFQIHEKLTANDWSDELLEDMCDNLEKSYVCYRIFGKGKSEEEEDFNKWKQDEDELDEEKYNLLIYNELKKLLSTNFCIIIEGHENRKKANELSKYIGKEYVVYDDMEAYEMKYYFLMKIIKLEKNRYVFSNKKKIANYVFMHRKELSEYDIKSFFRFKKMCELVYADLDVMKPQNTKQKAKVGRGKESIFVDDSARNRKDRANEFKAFLNKHNKTKNQRLTCSLSNYINQAFYAFLKYWKKKQIVNNITNGRACFRFLTEDCEIEATINDSTYNSAFSNFESNDNFMDKVGTIDVESFYSI